MKTRMKIWGLMAAVSVMLSGCDVNDPIYDTAHPETGQITLTLDWSGIGTGITKPTNCTADIGEHCVTLTSDCHTVDNLFLPGAYHANVYNTADKIAVSGTAATVATATAPFGESGLFIDSLPGWFFTAALDQTIEADIDYDITASMIQQVRELNLVIEPTGGTIDRIASITAMLSGVASTLNMDTYTHGTPASVASKFTKITTGADAGKYKATVHLLGITGATQNLKITLAFTDGSPVNLTTTSDIATLLAGFNSDKKTPLTLGAQTVETDTGAGFTCTIVDWIPEPHTGIAE